MDFISFRIPDSLIEKAMSLRTERDQLYGNIYEELDTDLRWVGDLGEYVFLYWLKQKNVKFSWHRDNAAGKPDFTIADQRIDIKTVKRKVPPKPQFTAQITAKHVSYPVDILFFCSYEFQVKTMWLLGATTKNNFIEKAKFYKAGEKVHANYTIRAGHEIFNAPISILEDPETWVFKFL